MYEKYTPFYDGYKQEMWEAARKLPQMVTELNRSCKREGRYVEYDKKLKKRPRRTSSHSLHYRDKRWLLLCSLTS